MSAPLYPPPPKNVPSDLSEFSEDFLSQADRVQSLLRVFVWSYLITLGVSLLLFLVFVVMVFVSISGASWMVLVWAPLSVLLFMLTLYMAKSLFVKTEGRKTSTSNSRRRMSLACSSSSKGSARKSIRRCRTACFSRTTSMRRS